MTQTKAKIKPYKFVTLGGLTTGKGRGSTGTSNILKKNVEAVNSIGATLNGLISSLNKFLAVQAEAFKLESDLAAQARAREAGNIESVGGPQQERPSSGVSAWIKGAAQSFWAALSNLFGDVLRAFIVLPALKWIADKKNRQALIDTINTIAKVFKTIWTWMSNRVTNILDGFSTLIDGEKNWKDRLGGFLKFALNLAAILIGIRWLSNPVKMIKDFVGVFKLFRGFIKNAGRMLRSRAGKWGLLITGVGLAAAEMFTSEDDILKPSNLAKTVADAAGFSGEEQQQLQAAMTEDAFTGGTPGPAGADGADGKDGQDAVDNVELFEKGGVYKGGDMPQMAMGGLITGPDSGYPVSLTGRGVDFIGHGTEMVLGRESGGAFVVPLNNRATRRNPNLTNKRFGEAFKGGFGREKGGAVPLREGGGFVNWVGAQWNRMTGGGSKPKQGTSSEKTPSKSTQGNDKGNPYSNLPAVQAVGRMILAKGFTVAEHPNFKKNNFSGSGANTGGWDPSGSQRVGGHSGGSLHYSNLALDVTDWRDGDWKGRTKKLAALMFKNRKKLKLSQIIHDGWGYWFDGQSNYTAGAYGGHDTHLHLGFLRGKADKDASVGGAGAGDIGGDMPSATGADVTGADTTSAQSGGGTKTYIPTAISDNMAGLSQDFSDAIDPSKYNPTNLLQMSKDNLLAADGAKAQSQAAVAQMMMSSMASSAKAVQQAQAIVKSASGNSQDIAIPMGGGAGGNSSHIYIGHYAPKFGLYSRK